MSRSIWGILGIPATRNVGDIKRAYAAKLKALDIDADPAAFQVLREARDVAIQLAEQPIDADEPDEQFEVEAFSDGVGPGLAEGPVDADVESAPPAPLDPVAEELNSHHEALCAILFDMQDGNFYAATPEEEQEMLRHFEAIAASPSTQNVDTLASASHWFAGAIAQMTPRSDALIEPASRLFGWDRSDELGDDPALAHVMQRRADLRYREEVSNPSHKLHGAWLELNKPAFEKSRRGWVRRSKILELLAKVRGEHPTLERQLDWYRIEIWEHQAFWEKGHNFGWILVVIFFAIKIAIAVSSVNSPTAERQLTPEPSYERPSIGLATPEQDIDKSIRNFTDSRISGDVLRKENPGLYELAAEHWQSVRTDGGNYNDFSTRFRGLIDDRLPDVWAYASGDLLAERLKLESGVAKSMAAASANACVRYFRDGTRQLHRVHRQREAELRSKAILAIDAKRPPKTNSDGTFSYRIPPEVIEKVGRQTGLGVESLKRALKFEGDDELAQCKVQLAIQDVVLELPPAARTKIIRDMMD